MEKDKTIRIFKTILPQLNEISLSCVLAYAEGMISMKYIQEDKKKIDNQEQKEIV